MSDFRSDIEAKAKFRRLLHWLDAEMVGKPLGYIENELNVKLDDYKWALKKHGLKCITGSLASLVDPKFLATSAATVAALSLTGEQFVAAISGVSLALGKAALEVSKSLLDLHDQKRQTCPEIAYVYELEKRLGPHS